MGRLACAVATLPTSLVRCLALPALDIHTLAQRTLAMSTTGGAVVVERGLPRGVGLATPTTVLDA
eukprot:7469936-Alexandrium_andersonii.AAC.1